VNIYSFSCLAFSFGVLLISALILVKQRDQCAIRFLLFSLAVCGWGFAESLWINQVFTVETSFQLIRFSNACAIFIPITWIHFVFTFIGHKTNKWFYYLNYAISLVLLSLSATPLFISGIHSIPGLKIYPTPGVAYHPFTLLFFSLVPYGFYHLMRVYKKSTGQTRRQLKYLMLGTIIGFGGGSTTFIPLYFYNVSVSWLVAMMPFYPFFTGVALIRYGLFDTDQLAEAFQREKLAAIGTMAASLNHELRNPLFIARGKAETYFDHLDRGLTSVDEKSKQVIDSMYAQLTRASDIMQRFSDFAKPFYNEVRKEKIVVKEAFENVLQLVSAEFALNKIKVTQIPSNGLSIHGNPRHFEEILFNLMLNACHAMGERDGELKLNAYQQNGKVIVEIADTGPGIAKQNLKRIFEPFYSTKSSKGTGLGLYITKQLVERNNGRITARSKVGKGTTFSLEFKS
jgi:signal transduction histidine kinase